jgi:hypothetical protein
MSVLWAAIATGVILFLGGLLVVLNAPGWIANINDTIALATAVVGFALTVFGAVKTMLGVVGVAGVVAAEVIPAGGAAAAGALLLVASQFIGG